jgi:hypothetical protein
MSDHDKYATIKKDEERALVKDCGDIIKVREEQDMSCI